METAKTSRAIFAILALTGGLLLSACGDTTPAPTPAPTTAAVTTATQTTAAATSAPATTAAATTAPATTMVPVTTAVATTAAPTTAATTVAATTMVAATTVPATTQAGGSGKAAELLANIPNKPEYLKTLSYDNYVAFRKLNNLPDGATFASLQQDKAAFTRFSNASHFLNPAQMMELNFFQVLRDTAGFDLLQADYDAEAGEPPNLISLAQGNFDAAAIDKAWTAGGAVKGTAGSNTSYTINDLDLSKKLQQIFIGKLALVPVPAKKLLVYGKPPEAAIAVAGEMPAKDPVTNNPAVKALLDVFGDPVSLYMGTSLISSGVNIPLDVSPGTSPGAAKDALAATIKATKPVPVPLMGGYAFYQGEGGAKTYVVANYYADAASAKAAEPILLDRLKNGTSLVTRTPYSKYWEVVSSEASGNVLMFKLNWKHANGLAQFVIARDFPAFLI